MFDKLNRLFKKNSNYYAIYLKKFLILKNFGPKTLLDHISGSICCTKMIQLPTKTLDNYLSNGILNSSLAVLLLEKKRFKNVANSLGQMLL